MKKLSEYKISESYAILKNSLECYRSLAELNGFLKSKSLESLQTDFIAFYALEIKYSLEMESNWIAPLRLFEKLSLNKISSDRNLMVLKLCLEHLRQLPTLNSNSLQPILFNEFEKKLKPSEELQMANFKRDFNTYLIDNTEEDALLQAIMLCGYIWHFKPFKIANAYSAIYALDSILKEKQILIAPILPLAQYLRQEIKTIDNLLYDAFEHKNIQPWVIYMQNLIKTTSSQKLNQLIQIEGLKKATYEQLIKYTPLNLPALALMDILFSNIYIKAANLIETLNCHRQTAYVYLQHLQQMGILIEKKVGREKLHLHKRYMDLMV